MHILSVKSNVVVTIYTGILVGSNCNVESHIDWPANAFSHFGAAATLGIGVAGRTIEANPLERTAVPRLVMLMASVEEIPSHNSCPVHEER